MTHPENCPICKGKGNVTISHEATKHDGGWVVFDEWTEPCEECDGTGKKLPPLSPLPR